MADDDGVDLHTLLREVLLGLFRELVDGPPADVAFIINPGDRGIIRSLAQLSAAEASIRPAGRSSVAAHVHHVTYGLELMNRWAAGDDNAFADATYSKSWERQQVTEDEWRELIRRFEPQARAWMAAIERRAAWDFVSLSGAISSLAHLAYHLGAIRQLLAAASGPRAAD